MYVLPCCWFPRRGRLPKKACLNNEVYGLRPAGAAIKKTIDSRVCLRGMQMLARAQWLLWRSRGSKYRHNCLPFPQGWLTPHSYLGLVKRMQYIADTHIVYLLQRYNKKKIFLENKFEYFDSLKLILLSMLNLKCNFDVITDCRWIKVYFSFVMFPSFVSH